MKCKSHRVALIAGLLPLAWMVAQNPSQDIQPNQASLFLPRELKWKDGPPGLPAGAKIALLEGDPSTEGMFVIRIRMPDGFHIPAYVHANPERVTIMRGTLKLGMGVNPQLAEARTLPAGTYAIWPAGMVHAVWTEGETLLQVHGEGPWAINYVNLADDPRNRKN